MKELQVRIEISGKSKLVGKLYYNSSLDAFFKYDSCYMADSQSAPISISLPFQYDPFTALQTKIFFEGLLPEGYTRKTVAEWLHVAENDYISILYGLGNECLGAIQIIDESDQESSKYEEMTVDEAKKLANEGATKSTEILMTTHLSLAGASGKVGLYLDDKNNKWYFPKGKAPSTHIVKQSHIRLNGLVTNEQLCLLTAKKLGIQVANSFIIDTGAKQDADVLFASERYDRSFIGATKVVDGLLCPLRLHQEDFSQALGIPSSDKYEKQGQQYLKSIFSLIRSYSANPLADMQELWKRIVFNYLIGNCDGHIKNNALLYSSDLKKIRLAPAYDIVSTVVYTTARKELSMAIAGEYDIERIDRSTFARAAKEVTIGNSIAMKIFDDLCSGFTDALTASATELNDQGYYDVDHICEGILNSGGIKNILSK